MTSQADAVPGDDHQFPTEPEVDEVDVTPDNVVFFDSSNDDQPLFEPEALDPEMQQVLLGFIGESTEGLDRVSAELMELEVTPGGIISIFRTIHTIKGTCGFFGFKNLECLTHAGENLLVTMRDDGLAMQEDIADALLAMVDAVTTMLGQIESAGHDGNDRHQPLS